MTVRNPRKAVNLLDPSVELNNPTIEPPPVVSGHGIVITELAATTIAGDRIWKIEHESIAASVRAADTSGGLSVMSADSSELAVATIVDGVKTWYAIRIADLPTVSIREIGPAVSGGNNMINPIWTPSGAEIFRIVGDDLQRYNPATDTVVDSEALPQSVSYYGGGTADTLSYRLQAGSGRSNPAMVVYASGFNEQFVQPFDPATLALATPWWVYEAMSAGITGSTGSVQAARIANFATFAGGYTGQPSVGSQRVYQWYPADGSTAHDIRTEADEHWSHPVYRDGVQVVATTHNIAVWDWTFSPNPARVKRYDVDTTPLQTLFGVDDDDISMHHADIGDTHAIVSVLNNTTPASHRGSSLSTVRLSDGLLTPVLAGADPELWDNDDPAAFYFASRVSISFDGSRAIIHQEEDGRGVMYLVEL